MTEVAEKITKVLEEIEGWTIMDLKEFKDAYEDRFGVTAAVAAAPMAMPGAGAGAEAAEEQTSFDVVLTDIGSQKIQVIKAVRSITTLGLKDAKDLVEGAPKAVKEGVDKEEAEKVKQAIEEAGGKVEIK